ncbi:hypothetical protein [Oscillatoria sp. FACHB-1406]|uniref:hypothetical protein n=1 Tax=Oscillatoria sp. FACHB-1406 TaxID=2692846 RepID=UPI001686435B|nr:hypothetical protein [Oscillatoria sp. FACHB-1406]MBD2577800.1 hypothetical protein [Oscillatoria sp. FACHB-1406]
MRVYWTILFGKTGFWLATEIYLNLLGLDNLADYSEFLYPSHIEPAIAPDQTVEIFIVKPKFCTKIEEYCPFVEESCQLRNPHNIAWRAIQQKCKNLENPCIQAWYCKDP